MYQDYPMQQILQRYGLDANQDLVYVYESLRAMGVDQSFIYALLKVFEAPDRYNQNAFSEFSLQTIIDYIQRTHQYYLMRKLPEIEQSILILSQDYSDNHPLLPILKHFFKDYALSLREHILEEESRLLPYVNTLLKLEQKPHEIWKHQHRLLSYSLTDFINDHDDTEQDLSEVRWIIQSYDPPKTNQTPYRILLTQLEFFEKDLCVHALIEDKVLVPGAMDMERKTKSRLRALLT